MTAPSNPSGTVVHEVRWSDALPWWLLFRAAGAAFSPTVVLLAALGAVATWAGWSACDQLGLAGSVDPAGTLARGGSLVLPDGREAVAGGAGLLGASIVHDLEQRLPRPLGELIGLVRTPFRPSATLREILGTAARLGWFVLVWSIFGTGITRHVALKLVGEDPPGPIGATLFGSRKWVPSFNSVLFVLVGILALSIPGALLGLAMRTEWGLAFAGAVWPLVLLGALVLAILAVGLVAGWPLMVAAVGVERGDAFQAISTAFSYLYQRPLHYAFYLAVAAVVAVPAMLVAGLFASTTETLALWATSFGMGHERTVAVLDGLAGSGSEATRWGVRAMSFWSRGLAHLLASFGWGYFWAIATAAYMLLRQDVDGTELDEVVIDEPGGEG
jgi:hypothetical protein